MLAIDLISDVIPAIKTSDKGKDALHWMEIFKVSHLPVVNDNELLGLVAEEDIYDQNKPEEAIGNHKLKLTKPFVFDYQHVYEVIEIVSRLKITIIPVVDKKNKYLGIITLHDLMQSFAKITAVEKYLTKFRNNIISNVFLIEKSRLFQHIIPKIANIR